eukprot:CAMPEP_0183398460 /NCGR_PEP_ID=MMETSP0370-20130417/11272_1 /TAXON_ID=268820 /ORGANISM="Peridinium aciculiferum, Strain PAER-2" /LENGTH=130 /DNA_ID=CAMNT_0025579483 /DNA_START=98 /DNA_END=491 /DNA_ORIENTATION=-
MNFQAPPLLNSVDDTSRVAKSATVTGVSCMLPFGFWSADQQTATHCPVGLPMFVESSEGYGKCHIGQTACPMDRELPWSSGVPIDPRNFQGLAPGGSLWTMGVLRLVVHVFRGMGCSRRPWLDDLVATPF